MLTSKTAPSPRSRVPREVPREVTREIKEQTDLELVSPSSRPISRAHLETVRESILDRPQKQQPNLYDNQSEVAAAGDQLAQADTITTPERVGRFKQKLAACATGEAFLLQGGPCAERFDHIFDSNTRRKFYGELTDLMLQASEMITRTTGRRVVTAGRAAGQFSKPRSSDTECLPDGREIPSFRGESVNGYAADERAHDPSRILRAHKAATLVRTTLHQFMPDLHLSHEGLQLNYELPLLRQTTDGTLYSGSGDMLWIGKRTNQLDHAHVELMRRIDNPIGIKIGPDSSPDHLNALLQRINPDNRPGKITLIFRMGAAKADRLLPPLLKAVKESVQRPVLVCDPCHGNTEKIGGHKTRRLSAMRQEIEIFVENCRSLGLPVGGLHLEMAGDNNRTECIGAGVDIKNITEDYRSLCDPCLNRRQALEMVRTAIHSL